MAAWSWSGLLWRQVLTFSCCWWRCIFFFQDFTTQQVAPISRNSPHDREIRQLKGAFTKSRCLDVKSSKMPPAGWSWSCSFGHQSFDLWIFKLFFWSNNYVRNNLFLRHPKTSRVSTLFQKGWRFNETAGEVTYESQLEIWYFENSADLRGENSERHTEGSNWKDIAWRIWMHLDTCRMYSALAWQSSKSSASNINPNDFTTESNTACQYFKISINFTFQENNNHD